MFISIGAQKYLIKLFRFIYNRYLFLKLQKMRNRKGVFT